MYGRIYIYFWVFVQCKASCGSQGVKYRRVRCVWYGTNRQAVNGCRNEPRPAIIKDCKGPPCAENCKLSLCFEQIFKENPILDVKVFL